jgi:hypothetical protein
VAAGQAQRGAVREELVEVAVVGLLDLVLGVGDAGGLAGRGVAHEVGAERDETSLVEVVPSVLGLDAAAVRAERVGVSTALIDVTSSQGLSYVARGRRR